VNVECVNSKDIPLVKDNNENENENEKITQSFVRYALLSSNLYVCALPLACLGGDPVPSSSVLELGPASGSRVRQ